jgi:peptide/nickel transport system permease protein
LGIRAGAMHIVRYIVERLVQAIPVLFGVTVFVFLSVHFVPGDPIRIMMHGRIADEDVAAIYTKLGMDRPFLLQYVSYVGNALIGDLGTSLIQNAPVSRLVFEKLWPTLMLLGLSALISIFLALPLALLSAFYRSRWIDHLIRIASMVGFAMPSFWVVFCSWFFSDCGSGGFRYPVSARPPETASIICSYRRSPSRCS